MPAALETSTTTTSTMASSGVAPAATMEDVSSAGVTSTAAVATMSASSASALLTDEEYVRQVDLHFFLQDAISLFTAACHTSPSITPAEYFEQYFAAVLNGTFILGRPYTFLCRNVLTRRAFVSVFHTSFSHLSPHDVLSVDDVHQLCCLLCPDFPLSVVRNASRIAANIEASVDMPFGTLCHNFLLLFFFSSYLTDAALIFRSLDTEQAGVVSVPLLRRALLKTRSKQEKKRISMPSTDAVESVLRSAARVVPATLQAAARSSIAAAPSSETIGHDAASAATQPVAVAAAAAHHTIMFNAFCSALFRVPSVVEQCMPASMIVEQPVPVSSSLPPPSPSPSPDAPNVPSVEDVSNEAAPAADEQS